MNNKLIVFVFLCVLFSSFAGAEERTATPILLIDGNNEITLSLVNGWNRDITDLSATIADDQMPSWLRLTNTGDPITISTANDGSCELHLQFTVTPTVSGITSEFDITLTDNAGNCWTVPVSVATNGFDNAPPVFETRLAENYPNPFNPTTTIPYSLSESAHVDLAIYNALGQKIRTLVHDHQSTGTYSITWDGHDDQGRAVSSGLYFCSFQTGSHKSMQRMMLIE